MRKMILFGSVMVLALTLGIVVPVFGAGSDMAHAALAHHKTPPIAKGTTLTITGSGTAYKIGNRTVTESASISLTATVARSSPGRGLLNFTSGSLKVGSTTYSIVKGPWNYQLPQRQNGTAPCRKGQFWQNASLDSTRQACEGIIERIIQRRLYDASKQTWTLVVPKVPSRDRYSKVGWKVT